MCRNVGLRYLMKRPLLYRPWPQWFLFYSYLTVSCLCYEICRCRAILTSLLFVRQPRNQPCRILVIFMLSNRPSALLKGRLRNCLYLRPRWRPRPIWLPRPSSLIFYNRIKRAQLIWNYLAMDKLHLYARLRRSAKVFLVATPIKGSKSRPTSYSLLSKYFL